MRKSKPVPAPTPAPVKPAPAPVPQDPALSLDRGEYRAVSRQDLTDYGVAYFKAHPGYGKDPTLPGRIMGFLDHYFDTKEVPGSKANPIQLFFNSFCSLDKEDLATDETPGCACGLNAAYIMAGFKGTKGGTKGRTSAGATSFMTAGVGIDKPVQFCTVVLQHLTGALKGHYHVTTFFGYDSKGNWLCRGNNQGNELCLKAYDFKKAEKCVALRMPSTPLVAA